VDAPVTGVVVIGWWEIALASGFMVVAGAVSVALSLGLLKDLAVATLRTYLQLFLLGLALKWIFEAGSPGLVLAVIVLMVLVAARIVLRRVDDAPKGLFGNAALAMVVVGIVVTFTVTGAVVGVEPWWEPRYVLPIAGMVIGNSMNGIAIAIERCFADMEVRSDEILALTALGATPREAAQSSVRSSVRAGMIPIINSMAAVGLVFIPGMMTGQILAGVDPVHATGYQIVVMLMIAAATALGTVIAVMLSYRRRFTEDGIYLCRDLRG